MKRLLLALAAIMAVAGSARAQEASVTQRPVPIGGTDIRALPDHYQVPPPPPFGANLFSPQVAVMLQQQANAAASRSGERPFQVEAVLAAGRTARSLGRRRAPASTCKAVPRRRAAAAGVAGGGRCRRQRAGDTGGGGGGGNTGTAPQGGGGGGGGVGGGNSFSSSSSRTIPATGVQPYAGGTMVDPNYVLQPGDVTQIHLYGATTLDQVAPVDGNGDIFIPTVGPIHVAGTTVGNLQSRVQEAVRAVYTRGVSIYATVGAAQPIEVYVTGAVLSPGQYALPPTKSVIAFLQLGGRVDPDRGSYRDVRVLHKWARDRADRSLRFSAHRARCRRFPVSTAATPSWSAEQGPTVTVSGAMCGRRSGSELKKPYLGSQLVDAGAALSRRLERRPDRGARRRAQIDLFQAWGIHWHRVA